MTDYFATPDDLGEVRQSDLQSSLGERLGARALDTLDPKNSASGMWLVRRAREANAAGLDQAPGMGGDVDVFGGTSVQDQQSVIDAQRAAIPDTAIADAKARVKQEGLEGELKLPDQPSIKTPVLDLMVAEAHERRDREIAIAKGPQGFIPGALGLVTSLGAGMIDPVQMAAFSIPVLGEARMGRLMASAGDSILNRTGARMLQGGAQGAVGTAALQPADWWLHTQDGQDYTFADALKSVVMGAGMGAGFHAIGGLYGDVRSRIRGAPLPGSPEDLLTRGLMTGRHVPGDLLGDDGVTADQLNDAFQPPDNGAGLANPDQPVIPADHPASVMADLPPAAQEDLVRSAIADVAADRPVRAAEMLEIAADHSPRIAESLEAWHGSPYVFDRFDMSKVGDGEGAQSYGHGLYFAENPDVARGYAEKLGETVKDGAEPPEHQLYHVRINADIEHLLDWDKPLNEQTPHVQQALKAAMGEVKWKEFQHADASTAVRQGFIAFHDESVSAKLRDAGIAGIKYLDQGSRSSNAVQLEASIAKSRRAIEDLKADAERNRNNPAMLPAFFERQDGHVREHEAQIARWTERLKEEKPATRNFVVFDDRHIDIIDRNGEPVAKPFTESAPGDPKVTLPDPDLVTAPKPRGRGAAHPDTLSLNEHLASQGGLKPDPELEAIYGNRRGPFVPGFGPLVRKSGMSLDDALTSAMEHGYMSDPHDADNGTAGTAGRTGLGLTPNDLLDHLDAENRGRKLYKAGHVEATKYDPDQEKHVILGALEGELEKSGADVSAIDPKLLDRTVEIVHRDGESDVMVAYERAIMEDTERYDALANARRSDAAAADLPGWDVPADAGAASADGRPDPADRGPAGSAEQGARGRDGAQSPGNGRGDPAAAAADPRWRELADVKPAEDDPDVVAQSRAADRLPEPDSLVPEKSLTALDKQAADAEAIWRKMEPTLSEAERTLVNDVLDQLKLDKEARDKIITDGAACLVGAIL